MGKYCELCGKGTMSGHNVSHSNRKSNRVRAPNVQSFRLSIGGQTKRKNICTRCIRSLRKQEA